MNENVKLWVKTLRAGVFPDGTKFEQGRGQLKSGVNAYCCLGVACELYRQVKSEGEWNGGAFCGNECYLPSFVKDWLNLDGADGRFSSALLSSLSVLNDCGSSFDEIANTIESEPAGLFVVS